jgi:hypothetical protein
VSRGTCDIIDVILTVHRVTALRVEDKATLLVKNSEDVLKGLKELQVSSDKSLMDTLASKTSSVF